MSDKESNKKKNFLARLSSSDPPKKNRKLAYVILLLAAGVFVMLYGNFQSSTTKLDAVETKGSGDSQQETEEVETFGSGKEKQARTISDYEKKYEAELTDVLESMIGVDNVQVFVNVDATEEKVYEHNTVNQSQTTEENDREGGTRNIEDNSVDQQLVIVRNGDKEQPVVVKTLKPDIRGVLVVAKGADNIKVKKSVVDAVTRVLDVPSHRVAVTPKKTKGD
ncbi:stage III sporulation protein AG [Priestia endophytica]|uniref:stage III sporulation protein AG n=1 Tax=Priestia endophytica TaxID=135735 RepID=UPI002282681E|nr:stage III sporulation protein AG [Priestia endophytica]MCY8232910.1 stage III sporulation protein AG [Priestia endophytica]